VNRQADNWAILRQHHVSRIIVKNGLNNGNHLPNLPVALINNVYWERVYQPLVFNKIESDLHTAGWDGLELFSKAETKDRLLANPNLGKHLHTESRDYLADLGATPSDIALVVTDYLNASAIHNHSINLLQTFRKKLEPNGVTFAPVTVVQNGNCAIGTSIAQLLNARYVLTFYGEKPFLHATDNIAVKLTSVDGNNTESVFMLNHINNVGTTYNSIATELINAYLKAKRV